MISQEEHGYAQLELFPLLIDEYDANQELCEQVERIKWEHIDKVEYDRNSFSEIK